jgi:2-methylcitrate dehydratase PrpD
VDAIISIRDADGIRAEDVERVDVQLSHDALRMLDGTPLATHNIQYVLSIAMHEGRVGNDHFTAAWLADPSVARMTTRVHPTASDALQARVPRHKGAVVTVHTRDAVITRHVVAPRGNPEDPLTSTELHAKFRSLCQPVMGAAAADELWTLTTGVADHPSLQPVLDLLAQPVE